MLHGGVARGGIFCELTRICSLPTDQPAASRQSGPAAPFLTTPLLWTNQVQPISRLDFWIWHVTLFWKITRSQSKEINIYLSHHKSYRYSKDKTEMFYDLVEQRYKTKTFNSPIRCLRLWRQEWYLFSYDSKHNPLWPILGNGLFWEFPAFCMNHLWMTHDILDHFWVS